MALRSVGNCNPILCIYHTLSQADNIVALQVVLYNGTVVVANATNHPDLYWALRGGGTGSFGVVTSFQIRVFDITKDKFQFVAYSMPQLSVVQAFLAWQEWVKEGGGLLRTAYSQFAFQPSPTKNASAHGAVITVVLNGTSAGTFWIIHAHICSYTHSQKRHTLHTSHTSSITPHI